MRLIDADKLIENIDKEYPKVNRLDMKQIVENQTTAYDVNKVVEQFEKRKGTYFDGLPCEGMKIRINDAIEIVKAGGIDGN